MKNTAVHDSSLHFSYRYSIFNQGSSCFHLCILPSCALLLPSISGPVSGYACVDALYLIFESGSSIGLSLFTITAIPSSAITVAVSQLCSFLVFQLSGSHSDITGTPSIAEVIPVVESLCLNLDLYVRIQLQYKPLSASP